MARTSPVRWKQALFVASALLILVVIVLGSLSGAMVLEGRVVREVVVIAADTAGRVEGVAVQAGDWVRPGVRLLWLDTVGLRANLDVQRARVLVRVRDCERARTQLDLTRIRTRQARADAQTRLARMTVLHRAATLKALQAQMTEQELLHALDKGAVAKDEYVSARTRARIAACDAQAAGIERDAASRTVTDWMDDPDVRESVKALQQAEAALAQARLECRAVEGQLLRRTLNAPVAGRVQECLIRVGEYVSVAQPLMRIETPTQAWIEVVVPESRTARLVVGQRVTVWGQAPPWKSLKARVRSLTPVGVTPVGAQEQFVRLTIVPEGQTLDDSHGQRVRVVF